MCTPAKKINPKKTKRCLPSALKKQMERHLCLNDTAAVSGERCIRGKFVCRLIGPAFY